MEWQQLRPRARGAFRKDGHGIASGQRLRHLMHDPQRVAFALTFDVDRASAVHQVANHRPMPHLGLGDKPCLRAHRMDGHDVEPAHVVGNDEFGALVPAPLQVQLQAQTF